MCWYITIYSTFIVSWLKIVNFPMDSFSYSKCISILKIISKLWTIILSLPFVTIYWSWTILNQSLTNHKSTKYCYPYWCDLKIVGNNFHFWPHNKNRTLESLLFRWSHETTIHARKWRAKLFAAKGGGSHNGQFQAKRLLGDQNPKPPNPKP